MDNERDCDNNSEHFHISFRYEVHSSGDLLLVPQYHECPGVRQSMRYTIGPEGRGLDVDTRVDPCPDQMVSDATQAVQLFETHLNRYARAKAQLEESLMKLRAHLVAGEQLMLRCANDSEREALACMLADHRKRVMEVERALANLKQPDYILP